MAPHRLADLEAIASELAQVKAGEEPTGLVIRLLADVLEVFEKRGGDRLASVTVADDLTAMDGSPWRGWSHGSGFDTRSLARLLRPFGIQPQNLRFDDKVVKGYARGDFEDPWQCYLRPNSPGNRYTATDRTETGANDHSACATERECSVRLSEEKSSTDGASSAVADAADANVSQPENT